MIETLKSLPTTKRVLICAGFLKTEGGWSDGTVTLTDDEFNVFCKSTDLIAKRTGLSPFEVTMLTLFH